MTEERGYGVPEVLRLVKITYRQLDYWARTELVVPSVSDAGGSGTKRLYSFRDIVELRVIKSLLDTGVSLHNIRKAIEYLRDLNEAPTGTTLVSDGDRVYAEDSPGALLDLLAEGQGVFAIAIDKVWKDLEKSVGKSRPGRDAARAGGR
ncbi:MAG: MerR family transcriptional regulator [Actinomycetota bacterium]